MKANAGHLNAVPSTARAVATIFRAWDANRLAQRRNHGHGLAHTNIAGENCTTRHPSPGGQGIGGSMPHGVPELLAMSTHTPVVAPKTGEKHKPLPQLPQAAPTGEQVTSGWVVVVVVVVGTVVVVVVGSVGGQPFSTGSLAEKKKGPMFLILLSGPYCTQ